MELISREAVKQAVRDKFKDVPTRCEINEVINSIPTIEEREEGEWIDAGWDGEKCSRCGWNMDDTFYIPQFLYCPNCGARMKGE